jgi:hypothetical protein
LVVRTEPSGVGNGVGVNVGVGDGVEVAVGVALGAGVSVSGTVAVAVPRGGCALGDGVTVGVELGVGIPVGGCALAVGVPNKPAAGSCPHTRASGDDPARGDGFNPSCRTVSRSSRAARNQKRAIARKAGAMAGMVT